VPGGFFEVFEVPSAVCEGQKAIHVRDKWLELGIPNDFKGLCY
jgi:hypothetical protein